MNELEKIFLAFHVNGTYEYALDYILFRTCKSGKMLWCGIEIPNKTCFSGKHKCTPSRKSYDMGWLYK